MKKATREYVKGLLKLEKGRIEKQYGDISVLLLFPNSYNVGMSNLGFQTMYRLMNEVPNVRCERGFIFGEDEVFGMESGRTMSSFDIVAFSIPFELDYPSVVKMLRAGKLPVYSSDRDHRAPLVIAGGVTSMLNPEPISDFIDLFVVGEGEPVIDGFFEAFEEARGMGRDEQLHRLSKLRGTYVPRFFGPVYDGGGNLVEIRREAGVDFPICVQQRDLNRCPARTTVLTPETELGNIFLVEISRGCIRGCRFCAARSVYHPYRFVDGQLIVDLSRDGLKMTRRIGLVGAAISEHPEIDFICEELMGMGATISVSSFRADSASEIFFRALGESGQRTMTIAPEAGTERLRDRIGKKMSDKSIFGAARRGKKYGLKFVKLYFMIGLPGETSDDVRAIADLAAGVGEILPSKVSLHPFVPKPGTPFEGKPMNTGRELRAKLREVRKLLGKVRSTVVLPVSVKGALLEGFFSRSGREISRYIAGERVPAKLLERTVSREIGDDDVVPWEVLERA